MSDKHTQNLAAAALSEIESGTREDFAFLFDGDPTTLADFLRTVEEPYVTTDTDDLLTVLNLAPGETARLGGGPDATFTLHRPRSANAGPAGE